ncbi:hypothetical protein MRX96_034993 [Rhipicephalus microplus]
MVLPPDGVCDYMFFDSLYTDNSTLIGLAPSGQLAEYLTAANSSQKTEHGVGINVNRFVDTASNHLKNSVPQSKSFLGTLLSRKVVGFGVLSINKLQFSSKVSERAVSLLLFCFSKILLLTLNITVHFGLAAYDVNYDHGTSADPFSACDPKITKIGNFARLYVLKKLKDIFLKRNNDTKDLAKCVNEAFG